MGKIAHYVLVAILALLMSEVQSSTLKEIEQDLGDAVITATITAKITKDKHLNPLKLSVSTDNGVVQLSGYVSDKQALIDALRLAKSTRGVQAVDAEALEIKMVNTAFTDAYITAKIEAAVLKAKVLDDESIPLVGINASTTNGVVTLSGELKSDKSIAAILKRASAVNGVKKIISNLSVNKSPEADAK